MLEESVRAISDMEEVVAVQLVRGSFADDGDRQRVLDTRSEAMDIVGRRLEESEYFLPELMLSVDLVEQVNAIVKSLSNGGPEVEANASGPMLIGTAHGDLHGICQNIDVFMLEINAYNVIDLDKDGLISDFVEKVREIQPPAPALSGFLTIALDSMKATIDVLSDAGLRDSLKIMVGRGQVDEAVCSRTNADVFGPNAMDAVSLCRQWRAA
ncbi:MAG: methionine synthase [Acidimicrobiaceae bacterium]|nr:methionine synthase [Acidimicrobiaceae bacterium]